MKRRMLWIVISMMAAFVLPSAGGYAGDAAGKKLTLMIYMCGSNLESSYGSASLDIQEMLGAELQRWPCRFYTGHCTGAGPFGILSEMLGDRLRYLAGGAVFEE